MPIKKLSLSDSPIRLTLKSFIYLVENMDLEQKSVSSCFACGGKKRLHQFPKKDKDRKSIWLKFCKLKSAGRHVMLCFKHFDAKCFTLIYE